MFRNQSGQLLSGVAIALLFGVLGSLITLGVTHSFSDSTGDSANPVTPFTDVDQQRVLSDENQDDTPTTDRPLLADDSSDEALSVQDLARAVEDAAGERAQFAEILAQLTRQVDVLEADMINANARLALLDPDPGDSSGEEAGESMQPLGGRGRGEGQGTVDALIAAGIDPLNAQAYQAQQDQFQLARLDLIDQAEREGWRESEDFSRQLDLLEEQQPDLRSDIGDAAYDRYLYEAGRNNRVTVRSVISGSAADLAGVIVGDTIVSYGNERIFFVSELQNATREGARGEATSLTLIRESQQSTLDVPRGPLGVTLGRDRQEPF